MKSAFATTVVAAALRVSAQEYGAVSSAPSSAITAAPSVVYSYSYYDDCSTGTGGESSTVTGTVVKTYCSECEEASSASAASAFSAVGGVMTTYTTVYSQFCPSGIEEKTYTVTESCSSSIHGQPRPSDYVPQGFTVTTATCHVCGPKPVIATLTTPTPTPTAPVPAPAAPTGGSPGGSPEGSSPASPAGGSSLGSESSPSGGSSAQEGSAPSGSSSGCTFPDCPESSGEAAPAPYPTPARYAAAPTGAPGSGSSSNSSAPITPFKGAASNMSIRLGLLLFAGIGASALLL